MKPALATVPQTTMDEQEEAPRTVVARHSLRRNPLRKQILKDSRQASKGYILAFNVPAGGE
jgi:hypothetical protein